ncbi:hypothetical protein [Massilia sp. X63]|jgi:hypothetical protein|uniref:hypothetical protein n=1 Tax=Massilia sp. X63 TaxID=3237285 RepID=UPI0034DD5D23
MKNELSPAKTWRGLPLSPAQNREVLNYIQRCERTGVNWDTPELRAMLDDMLSPPELTEDSDDEIVHCTESAAFAATHEEPGDGVEDDTR